MSKTCYAIIRSVLQKGINEYPLRICVYAPNSKLIRKQNYMEKFIKNDRSIFCVLGLGDIRIFLTGDIENKTISMLPSGLIDTHAHILKIPHHGSDTSTEMLGVCSEGCEVACNTVYRAGKFPELENNPERLRKMQEIYMEIAGRLEKLTRKGRMTSFDKRTILELACDVISEFTKNYQQLRKGMGDVMSGAMIETEARKILDQGISQGFNQGIRVTKQVLNRYRYG